MSAKQNKALVLLSGGQDSTTSLYWAMDRFGRNNVSAISFDYGQRHRLELECAEAIAVAADVPQVCLPIDTFTALGGDALTDADLAVRNDLDDTLRKRTTVAIRTVGKQQSRLCRSQSGLGWRVMLRFIHR